MRVRDVVVLAALLTIIPVSTSVAGSYREMESFSGSVSTAWEYKGITSKLFIYLAGYDPGDETVWLLVKGIHDDVSCNQDPILLKTAAGVVHRIEAEQRGIPPICGASIPAEWVKSSFTIQISQMHFAFFTKDASVRPKEVTVDTSDLDLSRIAKASSATSTAAAIDGSGTKASPPEDSSEKQSCVDGIGGSVSAFSIKVTNSDWADKILRPGMDMVPPAQLEMMGEGAYVRPQAGFLILTVQFTNTENAPRALLKENSHKPSFALQNSKGAMFKKFSEDFGSGVRNSQGSLNPGVPAPVMVVFDVPRDRYQFEVYWSSIKGKNVFHKKVYECTVPEEDKTAAVAEP